MPREPARAISALMAEHPDDVLAFNMTHEAAFLRRLEQVCPLAQRILTAPGWESERLVLGGAVLLDVLAVPKASRKRPTATYYVVGGDPDPHHRVVRKLRTLFEQPGEERTLWSMKLTRDSTWVTLWSDDDAEHPFLISAVHHSDIRATLRRSSLKVAYDGQMLCATRSSLAALGLGPDPRASRTPASPVQVPDFADPASRESFLDTFVGAVSIALSFQWFQVRDMDVLALLDVGLAEPLATALRQADAGHVALTAHGASVCIQLGAADSNRAAAAFHAHKRVHLVFTRAQPGGRLAVSVQ